MANYRGGLFPDTICLCGSMKFRDAFANTQYRLESKGNIVLAPCFNPDGSTVCSHEQKTKFDNLHKAKIDLCDYVIVLNVGGYIGESTKNEIAYAKQIQRRVFYLEPIGPNNLFSEVGEYNYDPTQHR